MLLSTVSHVLGAVLTLSAVVHAAAIPELEPRAADSTCRRLDVRIASKIISSFNAQAICANYLPKATKPTKKLTAARGVSERDVNDQNLEARTFKLPAALKRYEKKLLTQACTCLFPPQPVETTYSYESFPGTQCTYSDNYKSATIASFGSSGNTDEAIEECMAGCTAEGATCGFFWVFVANSVQQCQTDETEVLCVVFPSVATCYYAHTFNSANFVCPEVAAGNNLGGFKKVTG